MVANCGLVSSEEQVACDVPLVMVHQGVSAHGWELLVQMGLLLSQSLQHHKYLYKQPSVPCAWLGE